MRYNQLQNNQMQYRANQIINTTQYDTIKFNDTNQCIMLLCKCNLYYKRRDPYICSAKAPVLEGSGRSRLYRRKGTSVDRVYVVFGVNLGFFTIRQKRIRGGSMYAECNSGLLKERSLQL